MTGISPIEVVDEVGGKTTMTQVVKSMMKKKENLFTQKQKADVIPNFVNIFLQQYLPEKCNAFSEKHAVVIIEHFCKWLENRKFLTSFRVKKN
jgi:hypothetical protein